MKPPSRRAGVRTPAPRSRARSANDRTAEPRQAAATAKRGGVAVARPTERVAASPTLHLWIVGLVLALVLFGLVMVLSSSSHEALDIYDTPWHFFRRQAGWALLGGFFMFLVARSDYRWWRRLAGPGLVATVVLLLLVVVPGNPLAVSVNGSSRWLGAGSIRLQPSELAKLALIVFAADLFSRRQDVMGNTRITFRPVMVVTGGLATLVMLQPDLGTTLVLAGIAFTIAYAAGTPAGALTKAAAAGFVLALVLALVAPYRRERLLSFLDPSADPLNEGYQEMQSRLGLSNGGLFGTGLGNSRAKWGFLPESHTDFIFAIVGEELGFVGAAVVLGVFAALFICGTRTALHAPDRFGRLLAVGVTAWLAVQALVNVGAVAGVMPITGIPLPFVSYGGSSLLPSMMACGLLVSVARASR